MKLRRDSKGIVEKEILHQAIDALMPKEVPVCKGRTFYVYTLAREDGIYVGYTENPYRRLEEHCKYEEVSKRIIEVLAFEVFPTLVEALLREEELHRYYNLPYNAFSWGVINNPKNKDQLALALDLLRKLSKER